MPDEPYAAALQSLTAAEAELASVRDRITALAAAAATAPPKRAEPPDGLFEVVHGETDQRYRIDRLQRESHKEVLCFTRPPYVQEGGNPVEEERLAAGVSYRSLYETSALSYPGSADMPGFIPPGELARATPRVPMKLMIFDRERAILPFAEEPADPTSGGLLVLHPSVLVDALVELFEDHWRRGTPLRFGSAFGPEGEDPDVPDSPALDAQLLSLLMSGLPDKAIATQLGISLRTLQRRIRALMESTGTANRTQLAWYVAQQRLA